MGIRSLLSVALLASILMCTCREAAGQAGALRTISGRVTDSSGAHVPDAEVTAFNRETGARYTAASTSEGLFSIGFLQPGTYTVVIQHPGFDRAVQENVVVIAAGSPTVNIALTVGAMTQSVTVNQQVSMVNFENADRSGYIDT